MSIFKRAWNWFLWLFRKPKPKGYFIAEFKYYESKVVEPKEIIVFKRETKK